jgi:hypothetical protein
VANRHTECLKLRSSLRRKLAQSQLSYAFTQRRSKKTSSGCKKVVLDCDCNRDQSLDIQRQEQHTNSCRTSCQFSMGCRFLVLTNVGVDFYAALRTLIKALSSIKLYDKIYLNQRIFWMLYYFIMPKSPSYFSCIIYCFTKLNDVGFDVPHLYCHNM